MPSSPPSPFQTAYIFPPKTANEGPTLDVMESLIQFHLDHTVPSNELYQHRPLSEPFIPAQRTPRNTQSEGPMVESPLGIGFWPVQVLPSKEEK